MTHDDTIAAELLDTITGGGDAFKDYVNQHPWMAGVVYGAAVVVPITVGAVVGNHVYRMNMRRLAARRY